MNNIYSVITGRSRRVIITVLAGLVSVGIGVAQAALMEENFDSYTNGNLGGQGGWVTTAAYSPAQVRDGVGVNTSQVVGNTLDGLSGLMTKGVSLDWSSVENAVMSIDFYRGSDGTGIGTWAGFYNSSNTRGYGLRVETALLKFRIGATGGTAVNHTDVAGKDISITNDKWYRMTYEFSPNDNLITKALLQNLTDSGSIQVYFGANQASYAPDATANPLNWNQMVVLAGRSTVGTVLFDNITVIPEPATIGMMLLGSISALALRRMSR